MSEKYMNQKQHNERQRMKLLFLTAGVIVTSFAIASYALELTTARDRPFVTKSTTRVGKVKGGPK